jgi:PhnB protein
MQVQPYLFFNGRCEEALNFYREALGAEIISIIRFNEAPDPKMVPPGAGEKVMHASLRIGGSELLASDGIGEAGKQPSGFSLSIGVESVDEGRRVFQALAPGGTVQMDFGPTFWTQGFGQLTDRFGLQWMVNVAH